MIETLLFTRLEDPDGKWFRYGGFYLQQQADAVGIVDLDDLGRAHHGTRITSVRMAVSHPGRTGSPPGASSNRPGWTLFRRKLADTTSGTWETPEVLETIAPTIVDFDIHDQSVNLAGYQSQHYIERTPSTPSELIRGDYHYFAVIQGETAAGFNSGEYVRFHGLLVSLIRGRAPSVQV